ncbi:MAG: hypothetical protein M0Q94_08575 [Candidatus Cloacimonetes bacterium]|nr:hypothetical protein [Candidatus Cloacimonadota bacterium]
MRYLVSIIFILNVSLLFSFPITDYDFRLPTSVISPIEGSCGGINVASNNDNYIVFTNPALLATIKKTNFSVSFILPSKNYETIGSVLNKVPFLEENKFRGFAFQGNKIGLGYQVLSEDKFDIQNEAGDKIYQDYKLNSYLLGFSDSIDNYHWGLSLKLLSGRLVYLKQEKVLTGNESILVTKEFIDSRALGYSSDLGLHTAKNNFSFGFVVNDILSKIYWKDYDSYKIKTRVTTSVEYSSDSYILGFGLNNRWNIKTKPFLNTYYAYKYSFGRPDDLQYSILRFGVCSKEFKDQDNILFNLGLGYMYRIFKIDIALQSQGWKANQTQYLFSVSVGE